MKKNHRRGGPVSKLVMAALVLATTVGFVSGLTRSASGPDGDSSVWGYVQSFFAGTSATPATTAQSNQSSTQNSQTITRVYSPVSTDKFGSSLVQEPRQITLIEPVVENTTGVNANGTGTFDVIDGAVSSSIAGLSSSMTSAPFVPNATPPDYYWDVNGSAPGLGGTGIWTTSNTTTLWNDASGTGTPISWVNGNNAFFTGTAGTVTLGSASLAGVISASAMSIDTTGYVFTSSAAGRNLTVTGTLTLANNVATTFEINSGTGSATWSVGAISNGTGTNLTLQGGASAANFDRLQITSETTVSVPTTIASASGTGAIGYLANVAGAAIGSPKAVTISSTVTNNSGASFLLGANQFNTLNFSGNITGTGRVLYSADNAGGGAGTINVTGTGSNYTGTTNINMATTGQVILNSSNGTALGATSRVTVTKGSLVLGANNQIPDTTPMTLAGGTFNTGGFSEHGVTNNTPGIGALTLSATSIIDMANGSSIIAFANSASQTWTGTLNVYNYSGTPFTGNGTDQLYFGSDTTGLTSAQLTQINFYSDAGTTFLGFGGWGTDMDGEVVPVPEPSTWIGAALALGAIGFTQRRRLRGLIARHA